MARNLSHIRLQLTNTIKFISPQSGGSTLNIPSRDRNSHGKYIHQKLIQAWQDSENDTAVSHSTRTGIYIEFQSAPGFDIKIKSLENLKKGIRLCNVRQIKETKSDGTNKDILYITVFVPNNQKRFFFDKINQYLAEETTKGNPKNKEFIEGIQDLCKAIFVKSFWTDDEKLIPTDHKKEWCEIWLRDNKDAKIQLFNTLKKLKIEHKLESITFPERVVTLVFASSHDLIELTKHSDDIAEYRKAKSTASFLLSQTTLDQDRWVDDLKQRLTVKNTNDISICLLDTGVTNAHPLLAPILSNIDCQSVEPEWGTEDHNKHGTLMSGLLGYGDLQNHLESNKNLTITHCLESIKIIPPHSKHSSELWGYFTKQGVSKAEIQAANRKRIICMPVSATDTRERGQPSSWSGAIDQITSGADDGVQRLMIIAAGNADPENWSKYPDSNLTDSIHDPAQSWNALTVGAITNLEKITDSTFQSYQPLAKQGQLSPFTTTSNTWDKKWPTKPDVVFEGGNLAIDINNDDFVTECDDLSLISTFYKPTERLLYPFNMTSAATAKAANFAARIQSEYPEYWPETIRALMIHSARWSDVAINQVAKNKTKKEINNVLQTFGYGQPDLERALYCAENSLTLISEVKIQPFIKENYTYKTKDMHLYDLPWPKEILENLEEAKTEMRVTLSYFIEPGPGEIGWKDRYRYASHALRFDLNSPGEDKDTFIKRINKNYRDENEQKPNTKSPSSHWLIGSENRNRGSIHSDTWQGTAVELASSHLIAVFPRVGWWRERHYLKKYNKESRYALIVSISTPENEVDIYTPVKNKIAPQIII